MKIDPRSHVPLYLQIAGAVRAAVAAEVYRPGEGLPSLRNLAIELKVNPNTVQHAYDELEREGLIYSQRGKGLFVADRGLASAQGPGGCRKAFQEGVRAGFTRAWTPRKCGDLRRLVGRLPDQEPKVMTTPNNGPAIELAGLTKRFGRRWRSITYR